MKQGLHVECSTQEFLAPWPPALAPEVVATLTYTLICPHSLDCESDLE